MKSTNELKVEFINVFGYDFKLEQVNTGTYQIIDDCDRIWKEDIDLKNKEDYNLVNAVINHKDFFLSLYGFLYNYHSIFTDAKNEYIDIIDHNLSHTSMFVSEKGLKFGVNIEGTISDKINVQLGFEYNWQEKQFNYEILAWNPDATAFGLGHGLELFINSDATEPYKVAYYGMDVDADILQPELTQALDKIVGLLK